MLGVIISAVAIIMLGYLCVGLAGYLAFPTTVASNVLLSFSQDDWLMQARPAQGHPQLRRLFCSSLALLACACVLLVHWWVGKVRKEEARATLCRVLAPGRAAVGCTFAWPGCELERGRQSAIPWHERLAPGCCRWRAG